VWLYWLQQHGRLGQTESSRGLQKAVAAENRLEAVAQAEAELPPGRPHRVVETVVFTAAVTELARETVRRGMRRLKGGRSSHG
jgi:hypothetical protein